MNHQSMQRLKMEAQAGDHMTILKTSNIGNRGNPITVITDPVSERVRKQRHTQREITLTA